VMRPEHWQQPGREPSHCRHRSGRHTDSSYCRDRNPTPDTITTAPPIPSTCDQNDTRAMVSPPLPVVPHVMIIAEGSVFWVALGFASWDVTSTSKRHTFSGRVGLAWQIKVLWKKRIHLCLDWRRRELRRTIGTHRSTFFCIFNFGVASRSRASADIVRRWSNARRWLSSWWLSICSLSCN